MSESELFGYFEIPIDTDILGDLCKLVAKVLHETCNIDPPVELDPFLEKDKKESIEYDAETLMWVSALQVEGKVFAARCHTVYFPVNMEEEVWFRVQDTRRSLSDTLYPLAVVLNQIGHFTIGGQTFVPRYNGERDFSYHELFNYQNKSRRHFKNTPPILRRSADETLLAFDISDRYIKLKHRVYAAKLNNVFHSVDLSEGTGGESLLVYRQRIGDNSDNFDVWSPRHVGPDSLEMGAIFGFGYPNPLGDKKIAAQMNTVTVNTSAALLCLANKLTSAPPQKGSENPFKNLFLQVLNAPRRVLEFFTNFRNSSGE